MYRRNMKKGEYGKGYYGSFEGTEASERFYHPRKQSRNITKQKIQPEDLKMKQKIDKKLKITDSSILMKIQINLVNKSKNIMNIIRNLNIYLKKSFNKFKKEILNKAKKVKTKLNS